MIEFGTQRRGRKEKQAVRRSILIHFIRIDVMEGYIDHQGPSSDHPPLANFISSLFQLRAPEIFLSCQPIKHTPISLSETSG